MGKNSRQLAASLLTINGVIKRKTENRFACCNFQNYLAEFQNYMSSDSGEGNL
jgi:hypothetical protein